MLLEEYFKPHQEEITKVDDKHGTENILPKAEISKKKFISTFSSEGFRTNSIFPEKEKLELSHSRAPLMIYKYRPPVPDEKSAHERDPLVNSAQKFCPNRHSQDDV